MVYLYHSDDAYSDKETPQVEAERKYGGEAEQMLLVGEALSYSWWGLRGYNRLTQSPLTLQVRL